MYRYVMKISMHVYTCVMKISMHVHMCDEDMYAYTRVLRR